MKVKREFYPMTPSKKVFDVTLPNTKTSIDNYSDYMDELSKLDFTNAYEEVNLNSNYNERQSIISYVERTPTPPLRRSTRDRKSVDIFDPSRGLTKGRKSRMCNKKVRRSNSPPKRFPMERHPTPRWPEVYYGKVLDELALVQFVCMTSIAEGEVTPVDINMLD